MMSMEKKESGEKKVDRARRLILRTYSSNSLVAVDSTISEAVDLDNNSKSRNMRIFLKIQM